MEKSKAAQEMVKKRWEKTTAEERSKELTEISRAGWSNMTPEELAARKAKLGRKKSDDRCPCGMMTKKRAEARNHKCQSI